MKIADQRQQLLLRMKNSFTQLVGLSCHVGAPCFLSAAQLMAEFLTVQRSPRAAAVREQANCISLEMSASNWVMKVRHDLYILHIFLETCQCLTRMHITNDLLQITFEAGYLSFGTHTTYNEAEILKCNLFTIFLRVGAYRHTNHVSHSIKKNSKVYKNKSLLN